MAAPTPFARVHWARRLNARIGIALHWRRARAHHFHLLKQRAHFNLYRKPIACWECLPQKLRLQWIKPALQTAFHQHCLRNWTNIATGIRWPHQPLSRREPKAIGFCNTRLKLPNVTARGRTVMRHQHSNAVKARRLRDGSNQAGSVIHVAMRYM